VLSQCRNASGCPGECYTRHLVKCLRIVHQRPGGRKRERGVYHIGVSCNSGVEAISRLRDFLLGELQPFGGGSELLAGAGK